MSNYSQQQLNLLIQAIANGKMIDDLTEQVIITNNATTIPINDGGDDAKKVKIESLRGYLGNWNASTNTPTLANGTGVEGDRYNVNIAGTVNFGDGDITFDVEDDVLYSGGKWKKRGKSQNSLIIPQNSQIIAKRNGNTADTLEIGDRVWGKQVTDGAEVLTLAGHSYAGGDDSLYASYTQDGIGELID